MARITSIALLAFATSALAVSVKFGLDATPEVGRARALVLRQEPEPTVVEPVYEEVKTANADLAVLLQKMLDVMGSINQDLKDGKVQLKTETKLSPEEHEIASENIQKGMLQSANTLVEIGQLLFEKEGQGKVE
ncbi:hypothetical protein NHJ13734_004147 [Beauveria thailandica]